MMGTIYKSFPQASLINEWDNLLKMEREEVVQLQKQWEQIHEENEEKSKVMLQKRNEEINEIAKFLKLKGVDVYKYKKKGFFKEKNGYIAWFKNNIVSTIETKYPTYKRGMPKAYHGEKEVNGIKLYNNVSPADLVQLYDRISYQYTYELNKIKERDKLFNKSIEYANKHNIDIEYLLNDKKLEPKVIIDIVNEHAKEKYLEENVPDGTEIYLKHECEFCSTYIVGEHRCSCGNRRIYIAVEGNIIDGFYHYPEAY